MSLRKEELMRGSIGVLAACLLLSGFVVAGCGGGGDEGTTSEGGAAATAGTGEGESQAGGEASDSGSQGAEEPTSEAKADFVEKADAFCEEQQQQLRAELRKILNNGNGSKTPGAQQAALSGLAEDAIGPAMQAEAEELQALGAPEGDEEQVEAIAASLEAIATKARKDPKGLVTSPNPFGTAQRLANEYGLIACGRVA
jgi:hypothetical protein